METDQIASIIVSFFGNPNNHPEAHEIIAQWHTMPSFVENVAQILSEEKKYLPIVRKFAIIHFDKFYRENYRNISPEDSAQFAELFQNVIKATPRGTEIYNYAVSTLAVIAIESGLDHLQLPDFMTSFFPEDYYLEYLYNYMFRFEHLSPDLGKENQDHQKEILLELCPQLLFNSDVNKWWLEVWNSLLQYTSGFQDFVWTIDKMETALSMPECIKLTVDIISTIFSYCNETDDEYYYRLYQLFLALSVNLRTENVNFDHLMLLWSSVLTSDTPFIVREEFSDILQAVLEELTQVIECVPIDNDLWANFLFCFDRFLQAFTSDDCNKEVIVFLFGQITVLLDRELSPYDEMEKLLQEFWLNDKEHPEVQHEIQEAIVEILNQLLQEQHVGVYSVIAHLWSSITDKAFLDELGDSSCSSLIEYASSHEEAPSTALVFIKKVGVNFPKYHSGFFELIVTQFYPEAQDTYPNSVITKLVANDCQEEFEMAGDLLQFLVQELENPFETVPPYKPYDLASIILLLGIFENDEIAGSVHEIFMRELQAALEATEKPLQKVQAALLLCNKILKKVQKIRKTEWVNGFFGQVFVDARSILEPVLLSDDDILQENFVESALMFNNIVDVSEITAQWFDLIVQNNAFKECHYNIIPMIISYFPIPSFNEMIANLNPEENHDEALSLSMAMSKIDELWDLVPKELIHALFLINEQDTILYIAKVLEKRIQQGKIDDMEFLKTISEAIGKGIASFYPDMRLDQMCVTLIALAKVIGPDTMREILLAAYGTTNEAVEAVIDGVCTGKRPPYEAIKAAYIE